MQREQVQEVLQLIAAPPHGVRQARRQILDASAPQQVGFVVDHIPTASPLRHQIDEAPQIAIHRLFLCLPKRWAVAMYIQSTSECVTPKAPSWQMELQLRHGPREIGNAPSVSKAGARGGHERRGPCVFHHARRHIPPRWIDVMPRQALAHHLFKGHTPGPPLENLMQATADPRTRGEREGRALDGRAFRERLIGALEGRVQVVVRALDGLMVQPGLGRAGAATQRRVARHLALTAERSAQAPGTKL